MTDSALQYLNKSDGFEIAWTEHRRPGRRRGENAHDDDRPGDMYAFIFDQKV